jgi:hypothetical protein
MMTRSAIGPRDADRVCRGPCAPLFLQRNPSRKPAAGGLQCRETPGTDIDRARKGRAATRATKLFFVTLALDNLHLTFRDLSTGPPFLQEKDLRFLAFFLGSVSVFILTHTHNAGDNKSITKTSQKQETTNPVRQDGKLSQFNPALAVSGYSGDELWGFLAACGNYVVLRRIHKGPRILSTQLWVLFQEPATRHGDGRCSFHRPSQWLRSSSGY